MTNTTEYTLLDAEHWVAEHAETFGIPALEVRMQFEPEDVVQLMFENDTGLPGPTQERMWVEVLKVLEPGKYLGSLDNHPIFIKGVHYGDEIKFEARHIIKYINEDGQPDI